MRMNAIYSDIFKAIHEGKWMSIEYENKNKEIKRFWIGIRDLNARKRILKVDGLHLGRYTVVNLDMIYIDAIRSSNVIEGTYCEINQRLVEDIYVNPDKYQGLFDHPVNLRILSYLEDCSRMDGTPYKEDFVLVSRLDGETVKGKTYLLDEEQFQTIVNNFQLKTLPREQRKNKVRVQQLCMNVLSLFTPKGLYVLAYRSLDLDVKDRTLRQSEDITVCTEFTVDGMKESIRKYLDGEDYELLKEFEKNQELIKDRIIKQNRGNVKVDDMPYIVGMGMNIILDLHKEYTAIMEQYQQGTVQIPLKAFFGDLVSRPRRMKAYPITLLNKNINLDQLLAVNNAMKYPVAYIQGPPGTGKTSTIVNTISTAFFNRKTVLFVSYNNHPIDGVYNKLRTLKYKNKIIPFPIIRLGNSQKVKETLEHIKELFNKAVNITVYDKTLDKDEENRKKRAEKLSNLLKKYEEILDLKEREESIQRVLDYESNRDNRGQMIAFQIDLTGQADTVRRRIENMGEIKEKDALSLLSDDEEEFKKYLYYTSARYIKKINEPKNNDLKEILFMDNERQQLEEFQRYLSKEENIKKLLRIFPIVVTTCISAHKIGEPKSYFDMVIMDEASQCGTAVSLVPIIRGKSLMLVGDPQQLNPVILLDEVTNEKLRRKYGISKEYDYCKNSVYKTYLSCDAVSDEVLLHYHYRCNKKIIEFNNKKYYNSRLSIKSNSNETQPLIFVNMEDSQTNNKNTAPAEADEIIKYAKMNKEKTIGVITPFVNQKKEIEKRLKENYLEFVTCGTVHAFQGDEKEVILFSTTITDRTGIGTYEWLKNNKELINVATSRAKDQLIVLSSLKNIERLHRNTSPDDFYELIQYVRSKGKTQVTRKEASSRALGIKPFSTETEEAFLKTLNHAMENIWLSQNKFSVEKEVAISHVFQSNTTYSDLFYSGRFDFVVYEDQGKSKIPVLAIELDGKEHVIDEVVKARDRKKNQICKAHNLQLIRIENSYARRYFYMKEILMDYFSKRR